MQDEIDDNKYLIKMTDCDGDELTVASPWQDEMTLMMRITNDEHTNGIIIDLPMALSLMAILMPFIQSNKLDQMMDDFMNPKDFP